MSLLVPCSVKLTGKLGQCRSQGDENKQSGHNSEYLLLLFLTVYRIQNYPLNDLVIQPIHNGQLHQTSFEGKTGNIDSVTMSSCITNFWHSSIFLNTCHQKGDIFE